MRKMFKTYLALLFILVFSTLAYADMGAIVPVEDVDLSEPGQKAIIAHNGSEEILILGTDLDATTPTEALRFIPLPSEPEVSLAPEGCFEALGKLVKKHNLRYTIQYKGMSEPVPGEPVELRFHKKLGAHDVTVVKINDALHFREWVNDYFKQKGLPRRDEYVEIENLVADYVKRGIQYFVFDFVKLDEKVTSINPLIYRFESGKLYYPLKITNIFGGVGRIELFIFAKSARHSLWPGAGFFQVSTSSIVKKNELMDICPAINELLGEECFLQAFKYEGQLNFEGDIFQEVSVGEIMPWESSSLLPLLDELDLYEMLEDKEK